MTALGRGAALLVGLLGLVVVGVGFIAEPKHALYSYLVAFSFAVSLALGSLALLFIGHVTQARWFVVMRRIPEALVSTLPLLALLSLPLLVFADVLYPWVPPLEGLSAHDVAEIRKKESWLSLPFFVVRAALYFAIWIASAELLLRWSRRQDEDPSPALAMRQRRLSALALPVFALALTFATFDWLMGLEPTWHSNAFGLYFFTGAFAGALAVLILVGAGKHHLLRLEPTVKRSLFHVAGKLLFVAVILWMYIAYAQFFLIWIADLPAEVSWYLPRTSGAWGTLGAVLVAGHFALPFLALLSKPLKRREGPLAIVAGWVLIFHLFDLYWLVMPSLHPEGPHLDWTTPAALVGVGGLFVFVIGLRGRGVGLLPRRDPLIGAGLEYVTK